MTKLTDTQRILLATACQRADGSVLPLRASIKPGGGAAKAIAALIRQALVTESETTEAAATHRSDGDLRYGLFITAAGMAAIGLSAGPGAEGLANTAPSSDLAEAKTAPTKIATLLTLLACDSGVPVTALTAATGWLPHSVRAAITGLRKKGHCIERIKRDGMTCYRIGAPA